MQGFIMGVGKPLLPTGVVGKPCCVFFLFVINNYKILIKETNIFYIKKMYIGGGGMY